MLTSSFCARLARLCLAAGAFAAIASVHAADWKPEKAVEFVVGTGPGSGVDNTARKIGRAHV